MTYSIDGKCHNANLGTYGHECGKPAVWTGEDRNGFRSGFCSECKQHGGEAYKFLGWQPFNRDREILIKVNRTMVDDRGIVDEVAMRSLFNAYDVSLEMRTRIWREVTKSEPR